MVIIFLVFQVVFTVSYFVYRAVRQAVRSKESPEVQAAILAVHLGMIEEAEHILVGKYILAVHLSSVG